MTLKVIGAGLMFLFNIVVARILGAESSGHYYFALSAITIISIFSKLGLDNILLKNAAQYKANKQEMKVKAVAKTGIVVPTVVSLAIIVIIYLLLALFGNKVFQSAFFESAFYIMILGILPLTIFNLYSEFLKGCGNYALGMVIQGALLPLLGLILIYPLSQNFESKGVYLSYIIASYCVLIICYINWVIRIGGWNKVPYYPFRKLWERSKHLLVVAIINRGILQHAPILIMGFWVTSDDVGIFGTAIRVAMLVSFTLSAVNNAIAPRFSALFAKDNLKEIESIARKMSVIIIGISSPVLLVIIFFGDLIMSVFGNDFSRGGGALIILALGQFANALTGSVNYLLITSGNEIVSKKVTMFSGLLLCVACIILIPNYGLIGAAISVSIVAILSNTILTYLVSKKLHINTLPFLKRLQS